MAKTIKNSEDEPNKKGFGYLTIVGLALKPFSQMQNLIGKFGGFITRDGGLIDERLSDYISTDPKRLNPELDNNQMPIVNKKYIDKLQLVAKEIEKEMEENVPPIYFDPATELPIASDAQELKKQLAILNIKCTIGSANELLECVKKIQTLLEPNEMWDPGNLARQGMKGNKELLHKKSGATGKGSEKLSQDERDAIIETSETPFEEAKQENVRSHGEKTLNGISYLKFEANNIPKKLLTAIAQDLQANLELVWVEENKKEIYLLEISKEGVIKETPFEINKSPIRFHSILKDMGITKKDHESTKKQVKKYYPDLSM